MRIQDIIKELQESGYSVSFYKRKDGGYRITRINGESYSGSSGNNRARLIVGTTLSEAQVKALSKIRSPKGKGRYNWRRRSAIDEETKKRIKKIQTQYRKAGKKEGKPTIRNYRWVLKHKGKKEADRLLSQAERRIQGLAYTELVDTLIMRIQQDLAKKKSNSLKRALAEIKRRRNNFKFIWVWPIFDILYDWELGLKGEEAGEEIIAIMI